LSWHKLLCDSSTKIVLTSDSALHLTEVK
jgi:hypothetical protein